MSQLPVGRIRNSFLGRVIGPNNPGYDEARTIFYGGIDRRPAVIVRPVDASEVKRVLLLARETGLEWLSAVAATAPPATAFPMGSCSTSATWSPWTSTPKGVARGPRRG
jgi:hypothetical protein